MFDPQKKLAQLTTLSSENELVEFKQAKTSFNTEDIGKYFSALSNEANLAGNSHAWLVFGVVDEDHSYINTSFRRNGDTLQKLKQEIGQHITDKISFMDIYAFESEPGKRAILFKIPAAPRGIPIAYKGHYYARSHESITPLSPVKYEQIRNQNALSDWSKEICVGASIQDLSQEAINKARDYFKVKNPRIIEEVDGWNDETFLNKAKVTIDGKITNTAILLLGKPESVHFISPAVSKISWILKGSDGIEIDYAHFTSPLLLSVEDLYSKIRNLTYRYIHEGSLFPEEVLKYDPTVIREALNNCIAHQDYPLGGKINVVENEDESLVFSNSGSFLPGNIENVLLTDSPAEVYRNRFLADAMVNLNMIDTIGSGIRKMYLTQKQRFFPLPDYDLSKNKVSVKIIGKVLDLKYARKLAQIPKLSLDTIILLDKIQKKQPITAEEASKLREKNLIEGKRPNITISSEVANRTDQQVEYMLRRGVDDAYCKKMIIEFLNKFGPANRAKFEEILVDKLADNLTFQQKKTKIRNILQSLKKEGKIEPVDGRFWKKS